MFDSKSDYALNKLDRDAIVCKSATGQHVRLTREDFSSEEEFLRWKKISDEDYNEIEDKGRRDDDCLSLDDRLNVSAPSIEESLMSALLASEKSASDDEMERLVRECLTPVQFRRLEMYLVRKMTTREIAAVEGKAQQVISKSIIAATKKVHKILTKFSEK